MGRWQKLGLIFSTDGRAEWMQSHAQLPSVLKLDSETYRVYFASRDYRQYSHIGYFEIDMRKPERTLRVSQEPVLLPGPIGYFDEHGVYPSCFIEKRGTIYMYYIGWNKGEKPPLFYASIGLATSTDGGLSFRRHSTAPILSRSSHDPCLVTAPYVFRARDRWVMAYVSGLKWEYEEDSLRSHYHLKLAESEDGIVWERHGIVAIDFKEPGERNISRCAVIALGGTYHMWYGFATVKTPYRMGYARSSDGIHWSRRDEIAGIDVSAEGFDSEMIAYPSVFQHNGTLLMLYNGNNFGKRGIGLARLSV